MMFDTRTILFSFGIIGIIEASMMTSVKDLVSYGGKRAEPIVHNLNYTKFIQFSGSWGDEKEYTKYSPIYLFDYTKYANSFSEFNDKYPGVAISTRGQAISESTFGDVGRNKFGILHYPTSNFATENHAYYSDIVNDYLSKCLTYYVRTQIGIGFGMNNTALFLIPYISGILRSHGMYERYLNFGLAVDSITFIPLNKN